MGPGPNYTNEELQRIETLTLVIIGYRYSVTPEHAVEMFRLIRGTRLCVAPNAGNGAMQAEAILTFLQEVGSQGEG